MALFGYAKIETSTTQLIPFHYAPEELVSVRSGCGLGNIRCDGIYESEFVDPGTQLVKDDTIGGGTDSRCEAGGTDSRCEATDANHLPAVQRGKRGPARPSAEPKNSTLSCLRGCWL